MNFRLQRFWIWSAKIVCMSAASYHFLPLNLFLHLGWLQEFKYSQSLRGLHQLIRNWRALLRSLPDHPSLAGSFAMHRCGKWPRLCSRLAKQIRNSGNRAHWKQWMWVCSRQHHFALMPLSGRHCLIGLLWGTGQSTRYYRLIWWLRNHHGDHIVFVILVNVAAPPCSKALVHFPNVQLTYWQLLPLQHYKTWVKGNQITGMFDVAAFDNGTVWDHHRQVPMSWSTSDGLLEGSQVFVFLSHVLPWCSKIVVATYY